MRDWLIPVMIEGVRGYPAVLPELAVEPLEALQALWEKAGLDPENPFQNWIRPGMRVLIKPNWVRHAAPGWSERDCLVTHPSVIAGVVEMVGRALRDSCGVVDGQIVLADAPLQSARFETLLRQCSIPACLAYWRRLGLPVRISDLRRVIAVTDDQLGVVSRFEDAFGDPTGDTVVDLKECSRLETLEVGRTGLGVSNYETSQTTSHHGKARHRYRIANSLLNADVVVNLPKWKTHVKTGVTGALKNFIGVNCDKEFLPHFRVGSPRVGGDEYPDSLCGEAIARMRGNLEKVLPGFLLRSLRERVLERRKVGGGGLVFGGAWPGNDTLWRTVHDMTYIAKWLGPGGATLKEARPVITVMDAVVAGEGEGPLRPQAAPMGCLLFGLDPGWVDCAAAQASGFDWRKIPMLRELAAPGSHMVSSMDTSGIPTRIVASLRPPSAWKSITSLPHSDEQRRESHEAA
jgi:uncharacterized protein (DUF362 family)